MRKINNIQALRGVAVLAVVFFHLLIIERKYGGANAILPDLLNFGMFGVDLFFVISGFVMVTVTRGKFQMPKQALFFLYHRVSRIYPLYWVYTSLALVIFLVQPSWVNSSQGNQVDILASYLLLPAKLLPLVQVGWTLIHELYFYLVFFLIFLFLPERFLLPAIGGWGLVIILFDALALSDNVYYSLIFHPLTFEFLAGCALAILYQKQNSLPPGRGWLISLAGLALIAAVAGHAWFQSITGMSPEGWWRVLLYGVPAWVIVSSLVYAERSGFTLPRGLIQTGDASYSIYLSHLFTINVVGRIWGIFAVAGLFDNVIAIVAAFGMVVAVGFLSYWLVETPLLNLSRKLV